MIESVFDALREPVGLIGTIEYRAGDARLMEDRTTPDAVVLQEWFAKMVAAEDPDPAISDRIRSNERIVGSRAFKDGITSQSSDPADAGV